MSRASCFLDVYNHPTLLGIWNLRVSLLVNSLPSNLTTSLVIAIMASIHEGNITKASIRLKIWKHLEDSNIALHPRPVFNRIPNYRGATEACRNLVKLDQFKHATSIKIDPDKPLEEIRLLALKNGKQLYVPTPRLKKGLLNLIEVPDQPTNDILQKRASHEGISKFGREIDLDDEVRVDLVISGCVAVSREGWRIGKGEGYADLEVAMMLSLRIITPEILIVTCVHDSQIVDIPEFIMRPHDIPVDIIVTPTQIIHCPSRRRPPGVIWSLLTPDKISQIPILNVLREREYSSGANVSLKNEFNQFNGNDRAPGSKKKRASYSVKQYKTRTSSSVEHRPVPIISATPVPKKEVTESSTSVLDVSEYEVISFTNFIKQNPDWSFCKK